MVLYMEHFLNLVPSEIRSTLLERDYKDLQTLALKTDEILSLKRPEPAVRVKTAPVVPKRQGQPEFRKPFSQEPRQSLRANTEFENIRVSLDREQSGVCTR